MNGPSDVTDLEKLSPHQFDRFRDFIYRQSGIRMDASKVTLVSNRIRRRLRAGNISDFDTYYKHITSHSGAAELEHFLDAITTNETHFFRTPAHFEWFKGDFLTELILQQRRDQHAKELRVWSAACSTGEEPYSLAICTAENALRLKNWKVSITGTDISKGVLREAEKAVYKQRSLDEVTEQQLKRYFDAQPDEQSWQVRPTVRGIVEFRQHNIMKPIGLPPFDCIFIRNVLIYFDRTSKQVVIKHLINALVPGGYLVVGPSEGIYDMLDPLVKKSPFLYQKP